MTHSTNNPVLEFVLNVGETISVLWNQFYQSLKMISWGKFFLYALIALIVGNIINLGSFTFFSVIGSFILKCFFGKKDQFVEITPKIEHGLEEK